jgi:hypothetical protein
VAVDHFHLYKEDVALMAEMGLKAYRFSVSWPRIYPAGKGEINEAGLAFYDRLINELISHKIEPVLTLYHWDVPQALMDEYGAWESRQIIGDFENYCVALYKRFGDRVTDRPYPAALGARGDPEAWAGADLRFDRDRGWTGAATARDPWPVTIEGVTLELRPTDAGQVGLFPEHAAMLPWLVHQVARRTGDADPATSGPRPAVLHLFAYTGLATLATVAAGARLTHVDASRPAVGWARGNATRSGLDDAPVRWIVDDAVAFTAREIRRGRRYAGVILDPPSYGHGPGPGAWQLERDLSALLDACVEVLEPDGFALLTAHTEGFDSDRLAGDLAAATRRPAASMDAGDLALETPDGRLLRLGAFARSAGRA